MNYGTMSCCGAPLVAGGPHNIGCIQAECDRLRAELAAEKEAEEMSGGCLDMIREWCETNGEDMSGTPPMMYPEACHNVLARVYRELAAAQDKAARYHDELVEEMESVKLLGAELAKLRALCLSVSAEIRDIPGTMGARMRLSSAAGRGEGER